MRLEYLIILQSKAIRALLVNMEESASRTSCSDIGSDNSLSEVSLGRLVEVKRS